MKKSNLGSLNQMKFPDRTRIAGSLTCSSASPKAWERDWTDQDLPDDLQDVLALMGEALHDRVRMPKIAENFGCLPEQLLDRVRCLRASNPGQGVTRVRQPTSGGEN